ncbi:MAG: DNA adenine methylase [Chryseobacterium sp.]|nr:MAG: DNA adenine methylase [Chryseobacterium sp.]
MSTIEKPKGRLKTPISYYGGKQSMLKHILPMIPDHKVYGEVFFGGGAVFWAKEQAEAEVINDYNGMVMNFYEQLKMNFDALKSAIEATPYSRQTYQKALVVYENPYLFTPVIKAWAFWTATVQGFTNNIGSWKAAQKTSSEAQYASNKKLQISGDLEKRLEIVQIECSDAIYIIERMDSPDTFFYIDPPYVDSLQGHYGGYTQQHFDNLLEALSKIKGKFLLSSYPNESLERYREIFKWNNNDQKVHLSASRSSKLKIECLTYNYDLK